MGDIVGELVAEQCMVNCKLIEYGCIGKHIGSMEDGLKMVIV